MLLIGLHLKLGCLVAKNSGLKIYSFKALIYSIDIQIEEL